MADNEIDERPQSYLQICMTHEVGASDRLKNTVICRLVVHFLFLSLFGDELGSLFLQTVLVRLVIRAIAVAIVKRDSGLLPLQEVVSTCLRGTWDKLTDSWRKLDCALSTSTASESPSSSGERRRLVEAMLVSSIVHKPHQDMRPSIDLHLELSLAV